MGEANFYDRERKRIAGATRRLFSDFGPYGFGYGPRGNPQPNLTVEESSAQAVVAGAVEIDLSDEYGPGRYAVADLVAGSPRLATGYQNALMARVIPAYQSAFAAYASRHPDDPRLQGPSGAVAYAEFVQSHPLAPEILRQAQDQPLDVSDLAQARHGRRTVTLGGQLQRDQAGHLRVVEWFDPARRQADPRRAVPLVAADFYPQLAAVRTVGDAHRLAFQSVQLGLMQQALDYPANTAPGEARGFFPAFQEMAAAAWQDSFLYQPQYGPGSARSFAGFVIGRGFTRTRTAARQAAWESRVLQSGEALAGDDYEGQIQEGVYSDAGNLIGGQDAAGLGGGWSELGPQAPPPLPDRRVRQLRRRVFDTARELAAAGERHNPRQVEWLARNIDLSAAITPQSRHYQTQSRALAAVLTGIAESWPEEDLHDLTDYLRGGGHVRIPGIGRVQGHDLYDRLAGAERPHWMASLRETMLGRAETVLRRDANGEEFLGLPDRADAQHNAAFPVDFYAPAGAPYYGHITAQRRGQPLYAPLSSRPGKGLVQALVSPNDVERVEALTRAGFEGIDEFIGDHVAAVRQVERALSAAPGGEVDELSTDPTWEFEQEVMATRRAAVPVVGADKIDPHPAVVAKRLARVAAAGFDPSVVMPQALQQTAAQWADGSFDPAVRPGSVSPHTLVVNRANLAAVQQLR
ncbi:MAG TPA: hypothetical protein VFF68_11935, partial [Anaerolineaceae bacterium]|nr:hypothetical protein [Anaerolineaceae bacterium]